MKIKILIFLSIFLFVLIPKDVFALEYTANDGNVYQVTDIETFRDYCYFTFKDTDFSNMYVYRVTSSGVYACRLFGTDYTATLDTGSTNGGAYSIRIQSGYFLSFDTTSDFTPRDNIANNGLKISGVNKSLFLNHRNFPLIYGTGILDNNTNQNVLVLPNFKFEDIENKYVSSNDGSVNVDFPITKEEFYVLLVLVGTLNIFLFLKWCFPFKGGSDLK